jgi:hypothetical protein
LCNDYRLTVDVASIVQHFSDLKIKIRFSEGTPNIQSRQDIKITDVAPIIRTVDGARAEGEMVQRRWSWPGPKKRPVYNFRSDGREFTTGRCLIPADGFYEFTDPADPKKKRKDKWLFTKRNEPIFCIAGIWRSVPEIGEAFTMLTMPPGPTLRRITIARSLFWNGGAGPTGLTSMCQLSLCCSLYRSIHCMSRRWLSPVGRTSCQTDQAFGVCGLCARFPGAERWGRRASRGYDRARDLAGATATSTGMKRRSLLDQTK